MHLQSELLCFTVNYLVWHAPFWATTVEGRSGGSGTAWRCLDLLSRFLDPNSLHINIGTLFDSQLNFKENTELIVKQGQKRIHLM